jgi:lysine-N-methylase
MASPLVSLPVLQHWDCHASGTCCQEYVVSLTEEEYRRIAAQGWDPVKDLDGHRPFRRRGWLRPHHSLNHRPNGDCVFLSPEGRCRIHERHGYEAKPLACRLFPFVLVPVADHWRVSLRFACPSAAANKGRPLFDHTALLSNLAADVAQRENLPPQPTGDLRSPPPLVDDQRLDWADLLSLVDHLLSVLQDRRDTLEYRWRKCLVLADLLRQTRLDQLPASAREQTLSLVMATAAGQAPKDPHHIQAPSALGRVIFRLIAALCTRKDRGPNRGLGNRPIALLRGVLRFARGVGPVPRFNRLLPEGTFAQAEEPLGPLDDASQEVLERYYAIKVGALQFCGPSAFGLPFWEGLEALAVTLPLILWVLRLSRDVPRDQAAVRALTIIDDHFGFNPLLGSSRLRLGFRLLARRGELARLIAWYSR